VYNYDDQRLIDSYTCLRNISLRIFSLIVQTLESILNDWITCSCSKERPCRFNRRTVGANTRGYVFPRRTENALKEAVATIGPISVLIYVNRNLQLYRSGIYNDASCTRQVNHAVLVVGYGRTTFSWWSFRFTSDYWLVKNRSEFMDINRPDLLDISSRL